MEGKFLSQERAQAGGAIRPPEVVETSWGEREDNYKKSHHTRERFGSKTKRHQGVKEEGKTGMAS